MWDVGYTSWESVRSGMDMAQALHGLLVNSRHVRKTNETKKALSSSPMSRFSLLFFFTSLGIPSRWTCCCYSSVKDVFLFCLLPTRE